MSPDQARTTSSSSSQVKEIQEAVRRHARVLATGGGSKPALSTPGDDGVVRIDVSPLRGILFYDPEEFTFSAWAGTPVAAVAADLAQNGQHLPFDPPLSAQGATLGGTVAAGANGSGRYRYGGVRDFLIGVRFVDGRGNLLQGGGKVVKNAAGFDFPKLMVGSLGRLGILTELTFKVFPAPRSTASLRADFATLDAGLDAVVRLGRSTFDLEGVDLVATAKGVSLWLRVGGLADTLPGRMERISDFLTDRSEPVRIERFENGEKGVVHWKEMASMEWAPEDGLLVKVPVTPTKVRQVDAAWASQGAIRRYSVGANVAWVAWPGSTRALHDSLADAGLAGVVLRGSSGHPWVGRPTGRRFLERIAAALDPDDKFGAVRSWPTS